MSQDHSVIRYWGRKPAGLARRYISRYSQETDIVLDAFGGSGVFVKTALDLGRRAIYVDLNPFAKLIASSTIAGCNSSEYNQAVEEILSRERLKVVINGETVCKERSELFQARCTCGRIAELALIGFTRIYTLKRKIVGVKSPTTRMVANVFSIHHSISHPELVEELRNLKSSALSFAVNLLIKKGFVTQRESASIGVLDRSCKCGRRIIDLRNRRRIWKLDGPLSTRLWYPKNKLQYSRHKPFLKRRDVDSIDQFFLDRSLVLLSQIWYDISSLNVNSNVKRCLEVTFMATLARASNMNRLTGGTWPINSYWIPRDFVARNPYFVFKRASRHMARLLEKSHSVKSGTLKNVLRSRSDITFLRADSTKVNLPRDSVDYVIMDPPHTDEAQFLELSLFYTGWMKAKLDFAGELVINSKQEKSLKNYIEMIHTIAVRISKALKPGGYLTTILHEEDSSILISSCLAIQKAGFCLLRQSSHGDFTSYTFRKPPQTKLSS